jgi:aspartate aminotransferase
MTNGGVAAINVALQAVCEPGDEVVFLSPPWFFYELLILGADATPVRVPLGAPTFDLDLPAIDAAITPRTRAVLINTPHNRAAGSSSPATSRRSPRRSARPRRGSAIRST